MKTRSSSPLILIAKIAVYISFVSMVLFTIFIIYQAITGKHLSMILGFAYTLFIVIELFFLVLIFWRLQPEKFFVPKNIRYIKIIGIISIIQGFFAAIRVLLPMIEKGDTRLIFFHVFGVSYLGWDNIVLGLLILVIAVLFERAYLIQEEQSLTV